MRKFIALILAAVMVFSLVVPAAALELDTDQTAFVRRSSLDTCTVYPYDTAYKQSIVRGTSVDIPFYAVGDDSSLSAYVAVVDSTQTVLQYMTFPLSADGSVVSKTLTINTSSLAVGTYGIFWTIVNASGKPAFGEKPIGTDTFKVVSSAIALTSFSFYHVPNDTTSIQSDIIPVGAAEYYGLLYKPDYSTGNRKVTYTSSDPSVATVCDDAGLASVKALRPGTTTITATTEKGKTATMRLSVGSVGWNSYNGSWYYLQSNGEYATGWLQIGEEWYHFTDSGVMETGWILLGTDWFYLNGSGVMLTGWQKIGGVWYYFASGGAMATGWQKINGTYYYFASSGAMKTGWLKDGGKWYYLKSSGAMATGWYKIDGTYYYFASSGAMQTGWLKDGGKWYYLKSSGAMATGWYKISSSWYYFASSGAMKTGWLKLDGSWYYLKSSGAMVTGDYTIDGTVYHFDSSGVWIP